MSGWKLGVQPARDKLMDTARDAPQLRSTNTPHLLSLVWIRMTHATLYHSLALSALVVRFSPIGQRTDGLEADHCERRRRSLQPILQAMKDVGKGGPIRQRQCRRSTHGHFCQAHVPHGVCLLVMNLVNLCCTYSCMYSTYPLPPLLDRARYTQQHMGEVLAHDRSSPYFVYPQRYRQWLLPGLAVCLRSDDHGITSVLPIGMPCMPHRFRELLNNSWDANTAHFLVVYVLRGTSHDAGSSL